MHDRTSDLMRQQRRDSAERALQAAHLQPPRFLRSFGSRSGCQDAVGVRIVKDGDVVSAAGQGS
jgi:hypothetical protein